MMNAYYCMKESSIWLSSSTALVKLLYSTPATWMQSSLILNFRIICCIPDSIKSLSEVDKAITEVQLMLQMFIKINSW